MSEGSDPHVTEVGYSSFWSISIWLRLDHGPEHKRPVKKEGARLYYVGARLKVSTRTNRSKDAHLHCVAQCVYTGHLSNVVLSVIQSQPYRYRSKGWISIFSDVWVRSFWHGFENCVYTGHPLLSPDQCRRSWKSFNIAINPFFFFEVMDMVGFLNS